jgi:hypothetical protein
MNCRRQFFCQSDLMGCEKIAQSVAPKHFFGKKYAYFFVGKSSPKFFGTTSVIQKPGVTVKCRPSECRPSECCLSECQLLQCRAPERRPPQC